MNQIYPSIPPHSSHATHRCSLASRCRTLCCLMALLPSLLMAHIPAKDKNGNKAIFTVTTYDKSGKQLFSGYGFFLNETGIGLAPYYFFEGASKAEVTDYKGKKWAVQRIQGASDMYDMIKFTTNCEKSESYRLATEPATEGSKVTRFISDGKEGLTTIQADVTASKKYDNLTYYTLASKADNASTGTPVLNAAGEVVGVMQRSSEKELTKCFAADIAVEKYLTTSAISAGLASLNNIYIPKQLPADTLQASSYLYLLSKNSQDTLSYLTAINDFKEAFPDLSTAYVEHALFCAAGQKYDEAEKEYEEAFKAVKDQADVHYNLSKLIYRLNMYTNYEVYKDWKLEKALDEANKAYETSPLPIYQLQVGDCQYALKQYENAFNTYQAINQTSFASAQTLYYASKAREMWDNDSTTVLALLDSALARFPQPYHSDAGPYILHRAKTLYKFGRYRDSALDFDTYEKLIGTRNLNDNFFYMKEQADLAAGLFPWALDDIDKALSIRPKEYLYVVEKAVIQLRVGSTDEAIYQAEQALKLNPEGADAYKVLGIAYGQNDNKEESLKYLKKAKELGDPQVDEWIEKLQ